MEKTTGILRIGAIGDLLNITPAIRRYKEAHQDENLEVLCGESCADALANNPYIDKLITINDTQIYNGTLRQKLSVFFLVLPKITHWDKCFVIHEDTRWTFLANLAGILEVFPLTDITTIKNRPDRYNLLINRETELKYSTEFYPLLSDIKNLPTSYICIAPRGARNSKNDNPQRRWQGFPDLINSLKQDYNIVILGSQEDSLNIEGTINLCGKTTLSEAYNIICGAEFFIGNDSGLLHLAGCSKTPAYGIFTATSPAELLPSTSGVIPISASLPCSPCEKSGNFRNDCKMECSFDIGFEKVAEIIKGAHLCTPRTV